jgi:hypothetical protein
MERSIAALPFQNHNPNNEESYFTVGMQDETRSRVTSREPTARSVFHFGWSTFATPTIPGSERTNVR